MIFDMKVSHNYASFFSGTTFIVVDSFDNYNFNVRIGTISSTNEVGTITATSDFELNEKIMKLYEKNSGTS